MIEAKDKVHRNRVLVGQVEVLKGDIELLKNENICKTEFERSQAG